MRIHFLDVGQGDAILIQTPENKDIIIDGGPDNKILNELGQVMPFWDNTIDIMILTHPHSDHIIGLIEILNRYNVKQIFYTGVPYPSIEYTKWLSLIAEKQIPTVIIKSYINLELENQLTLEFLYPDSDISQKHFEEINNSSIVNLLTYNNNKFLFTGDAEFEVEDHLIETYQFLQTNLLKIGHHGSHSSSSDAFLTIISPQFAIIQVGVNNTFNHPHLITLKRLERNNIPIFRTDLLGTITFFSNGQNIWTNNS